MSFPQAHADAPPDLEFRVARHADIPRLQALYRQLIPEERPAEEDMRDALEAIMAESEAVLIVIGELGGSIVATCQLVTYHNLIRAPFKKAVIDSVVVDAPFRHRGIGTAMIRWIIDHVKQRECSIVLVSSSSSREIAPYLYRKVGFEAFGTAFSLDCRDKAGRARHEDGSTAGRN